MKSRIVLVEPGKVAQITEMELSLENIQKVVGGMIQAVYPWKDKAALVCNDEGKLLEMPPNRALEDEKGHVYDIVCGTFFICGVSDEDLTGLSNEQAQLYLKKFRNPQKIARRPDGTLLIIEYRDFTKGG